MSIWAYRISVIVAALALGYLSVAATLANVAAAQLPAFALRLWPGHAVANARLADQVLAANPAAVAPAVARAARPAAEALRRNPTLAPAARILAMQAALRGDQARATALFEYSAAMSKRDIPTQFWLLERRVQEDDVRGALAHFGIALRVSPGTREILFPVLTSALAEPHLVRPIAELVRDGTEWKSPFLYHAGEHATDPRHAAALYLMLAQLRSPPEPELLAPLMGRLVQAGGYESAARLYRLIDRQWRLEDVNAQLDGGFERTGDAPPFGWALNGGVAWRGAAPGSQSRVIYIGGDAADADWAARRIVLVPAGRYTIQGRYGVSEGRPQGEVEIEVTCLNAQETHSSATIPLATGAGRFRRAIEVPGGCRAQWFSIGWRGQSGGPSTSIWLDDLRLTRG